MSKESRHPFLQGLSKHRGVQPTIITIFGASGDLCARKLVPAIYNLAVDNLLPADFYLIGYGRKPIPDEEFREVASDAISKFSRRSLNKEIWERIEKNTFYCSGGYDEAEAFQKLSDKIASIEKDAGREMQSVCYISTPPSVFEPIIKNLGEAGLATKYQSSDKHTKVVIEKPFGKDLESARNLNRVIQGVFQERQVYRIDHYLGKETVQDLLVQRFANSIFEPLWNRNYVDNVQITVGESLGVGTRGGYYEQSGATRDMIQNHTMQLLALTAMEAPASLDAESIRDEKVKLLKAIKPLRLGYSDSDVVRAQYGEGLIAGEKVPGYRQEEGVSPKSETETYAALRLTINNWRWQGVPFYLRSGKRMARRVTEIAIQFKRPPSSLFSENEMFNLANNALVFQIQPDEGSTILLNGKIPGLQTRTQPVKMHFRYSTTFGSNTPEAYERLVLDAMIGDGTLFIRGDETEASWNLITPLHDFWKSEGQRGIETYAAGSWGPNASDRMLWQNNHEWRRP
ncbi:glucose-6-phosphate dehydrogenase [Pelagicoccus sp. SDUM812003]|uniref:glucose-6-phosphate dehydrogenase n=1 Tax=Pelagicoccus sp. SDUM812003 TaxID=3041267 RepID=UPI00280D37C5|nr:glucose-6-phosphate dehydrogenase [Pelagicoccus sp. SDUM812003]MDQ8202384.1 glucose-6-phosphate dehydrogenase [Pelagicoccus sp. SDUM812003]